MNGRALNLRHLEVIILITFGMFWNLLLLLVSATFFCTHPLNLHFWGLPTHFTSNLHMQALPSALPFRLANSLVTCSLSTNSRHICHNFHTLAKYAVRKVPAGNIANAAIRSGKRIDWRSKRNPHHILHSYVRLISTSFKRVTRHFSRRPATIHCPLASTWPLPAH